MKALHGLVLTIFSSMALAGCGNNAPSVAPQAGAAQSAAAPSGPEAEVRAAVQDHVAHARSINLSAFDTKFEQVNIQGDKAQAKVAFEIKNTPGAVMEMNYKLEKRGGAWAVTESNPADGGAAHPTGQGNTGGAPGSHSLADTLRDFRDSANGRDGQPALPPGHPPVGGSGSGSGSGSSSSR